MKNQKGQTMFELIMALMVAMVIVTAIVSVVTVSLRNSLFAKQQSEATRFAQEGLEWVRSQRDSSWTTFYAKSGTVMQRYCVNTLAWPASVVQCDGTQFIAGTSYYRDLELQSFNKDTSNPDFETVQANVIVSWNDARGKHQSRLTTQFTDWR